MATYSYSQLEGLWIQAGGSKALAPLMAAIAMAESGGNSDSNNYTDNGGTQTSWGLWQISNGTHSMPVGNIDNALVNAQQAVAKYKSQGLSAWGTYTSGAYKQYLNGSVPPSAQVSGSGGQSAQQADLTSFTTGATDVLKSTGTLLHGTAVVLDRAFALFAPGQGWRIVFGATAVASAAGGVTAFRSGGEDEAGNLPLAILLVGVAALAGFMAFRPWPQTSDGAIRPGAYLVDVIEGKPPPAGPESLSPQEVQLTEAGLGALVALWAAGKIAQGSSSIINGATGLGGILGKLWSWAKGLGGEAGEAGEAA